MSRLRQEERDDAVPQDGGFANEDDLHPSDRALLDLAGEDLRRDPADRGESALTDDEALYQDVSLRPVSEETAVEPDNDDQETLDGLNELEESVRVQTEDRGLGDGNDFET